MFCTKCGTSNSPEARFCDSCGSPLRAEATGNSGPAFDPNDPRIRTASSQSRANGVGVAVVRNPGAALALSFIIPGAGQLYNGQIGKGIAMFVGMIISALLAAFVIGIFTALGIWIWAMVDAYQTANALNARL